MANRTNTLINIHGVDSQWHICMWMKILRRITDCHQIDATYEGFFCKKWDKIRRYHRHTKKIWIKYNRETLKGQQTCL